MDILEYTISPMLETIEIKKTDIGISIYKLAGKADIHIRGVTEEFIRDLYNRLCIELKPKTMRKKVLCVKCLWN